MSKGPLLKKVKTHKLTDRLQLATHAAGVGIWDWDLVTDTIIWDDTVFQLYGFSPETFTPSYIEWESMVHHEDINDIRKGLQMALAGQKDFDSQFRVFWPDGSVRYIRSIGFVQRDENAVPLRMIGTNWDVTEKSVAVRQLAETNRELSRFFNVIDEVFFSVDMVNSKVIQISNACEKLYGYNTSDFLANHLLWFDLIHPDDKHITQNEDRILARGENVNNQYRIIRKDKTVRWVETTIIPTLNGKRKLVRVDGVTRDITERKNAETELRLSEERLRRIIDTTQDGIWTIDEYNKTNFVNKRICEILEYTPEEMMGKEFYDFMDEEGRASAIACMEKKHNGAKANLDIRYVTKTGRHVWTNISANPIFDEHGKYSGSLAMVTDITQRKIDEEELKRSEANLRTLFDNTDSAYILISADLKVVSFNNLAQKYTEEHNVLRLEPGKSVQDYFSEDKWESINESIDKVRNGETIRYELSHSSADGSTRWYSIRWLGVKNADNKNLGFILANKEITERKIAVLEREKIIADLIQRNKDLEQFTFIVSHNLRAPVANIIGLADMLNEYEVDEEGKEEILNRISASVQNIDNVITDLNHILQARELVNEKKENVVLHELVDAIKESIRNILDKEHVDLQYSFDKAACIYSTRSYLYSVFYNLISNSIKYRQTGIDPQITIRSSRQDDKIELRFIDNGKGIDLDKNGAQLFGLYKRFDTSMEGKGMGLFMVKTQVEALGGTIQIDSSLGGGTEFIIQLPA